CCTPTTCAANWCDSHDDGCGGLIDCGGCPAEYKCDASGNCVTICPEGLTHEPFGAICILKDDWTDSGSISGYRGSWLYSATAESRMYNGIRQVRITNCQGYGGSCNTGWSNDAVSCKYFIHDVYQLGCYATVSDRYEAKLYMGNLYPDRLNFSGYKNTTFGPGIATPAGAKGAHEGFCVAPDYFQNCKKDKCSNVAWPGKCISYHYGGCSPLYWQERCGCESGYRLIKRLDRAYLYTTRHEGVGTYRNMTYECVKN
ncbi:hypothetical protein KAU19_00030, partial [Candidatus Parcubacteria bacterium]|nr:hypothetical protein [Candidatus Parcubacteria bacterium]